MRRHISRSRILFLGLVFGALTLLLVPPAQVSHLRAQAYSSILPALRPFAKRHAEPLPAVINIQLQPAPAPAPQLAPGPQVDYAKELDEARIQLVQLQELLAKENVRTAPPQLPSVSADIIARKDLWQETLFALNKGEAEGVKLNAGVLHRGAVLGRIVSVGPHASCMALLTQKGLSVTARLIDSRHEGVLQGTKESAAELADGERFCRMLVIGREVNVKAGEHVVTSGYDGTFPPGLWLGDVIGSKKIGDVQWEVQVRPACNENQIESVYVLTVAPPEVPWPAPKSSRHEVRSTK